MKTLPPIKPTAEQLPLISDNSLGVEVIRGAAGSGKTSTAILRLRSLAYWFEERREREGRPEPISILILTFNRTLSGYVSTLIEEQVKGLSDTKVTVDTFARWAMSNLGWPKIVQNGARENKLRELGRSLKPLSPGYIFKEVDYLLGRFRPNELNTYLTAERTGRGTDPRVEQAMRKRILDEVVGPYKDWLQTRGEMDWNDLAVSMTALEVRKNYDIVVLDESQDFSANQLRAVQHHMATPYSATFVIDTVQRIYARGFTWVETGFDMRGAKYFSLKENHRNTKQIASFAAGILHGMAVEPDGSLPDLNAAKRAGSKPIVIKGLFSKQVRWAIDFIRSNIDLKSQTVAFLHPLGYGYFDFLKGRLNAVGIPFVEISREAEWPEGPENVALSTFHSAKGLEFDHVFILGLNAEVTAHGDSISDDQLAVLRKLFAVAVARARDTVTVGYKEAEKSALTAYLVGGTFDEVVL